MSTKRQDSEPEPSLYSQVLNAIFSGHFSPGAKIAEQTLAAEFGVSRTPLRESLFQLESNGFLSYELNKGFRVPELSKEELRECYPIIWNLEIEALSTGFLLLSARVPELHEINLKFGRSKQPATLLKYDKHFHGIICGVSANRTLQSIVDNLKLRMRRYDMLFFSEPALVRQSYNQHETIIDRINEQDLSGATKVLKSNWQTGLENLLSQM